MLYNYCRMGMTKNIKYLINHDHGLRSKELTFCIYLVRSSLHRRKVKCSSKQISDEILNQHSRKTALMSSYTLQALGFVWHLPRSIPEVTCTHKCKVFQQSSVRIFKMSYKSKNRSLTPSPSHDLIWDGMEQSPDKKQITQVSTLKQQTTG